MPSCGLAADSDAPSAAWDAAGGRSAHMIRWRACDDAVVRPCQRGLQGVAPWPVGHDGEQPSCLKIARPWLCAPTKQPRMTDTRHAAHSGQLLYRHACSYLTGLLACRRSSNRQDTVPGVLQQLADSKPAKQRHNRVAFPLAANRRSAGTPESMCRCNRSGNDLYVHATPVGSLT